MIEQSRIDFRVRKQEEQSQLVGRERAEVEQQLEELEEEAQGGSIIDMLNSRNISLQQSPLPDE